ncbi:MAG: hypothetical protein JW751_28150, partial [Polyangiaceae bacterium]|nr:hypothetical protein [Polyangiaceae bacterium]
GQIRPWPSCRAQPADMTCGTDEDCRSKLDSYWRCVDARCERDRCTIDAECVDRYGEGWSCDGLGLCAEGCFPRYPDGGVRMCTSDADCNRETDPFELTGYCDLETSYPDSCGNSQDYRICIFD